MAGMTVVPPKTVPELIDAFGGVPAFCRAFGCNRQTVHTWRRRGKMPAEMDVRIVVEARRRDLPITYEILARIRAPENAGAQA